MKCAVILIAVASACGGTSPVPYYVECSKVDRIARAAVGASATHAMALEILERIAEGRMSETPPEAEVQVGLKPGELHKPVFRDELVRSHALRKIGELDTSEALSYLRNLKREDIQPDTSGQMWSAAQIALRQAECNRISDETSRVRFLEDLTSQGPPAASWAVEELCNRGSRQSIPVIENSIRRGDHTARGVARIAFCEARIDIISSDPDRVTALGSFLTVRNGVTDPELLGWAINQLRDIDLPRAEAELERYADEIESIP